MQKQVKVGDLFKVRKNTKIKMKTVQINFKTIPLFIENENTVMERKEIIKYHELFQKELKAKKINANLNNSYFKIKSRNYSHEALRPKSSSKENHPKKMYLRKLINERKKRKMTNKNIKMIPRNISMSNIQMPQIRNKLYMNSLEENKVSLLNKRNILILPICRPITVGNY